MGSNRKVETAYEVGQTQDGYKVGVWEILSQVYPYPRYIGSYQEFYMIIGRSMKHPAQARRKRIQGLVYLEFEISPQGKAVNLKVLNDSEHTFTDAVIETFQLIPNQWIAAVHNQQPVSAKKILPIEFRLDPANKKIALN